MRASRAGPGPSGNVVITGGSGVPILVTHSAAGIASTNSTSELALAVVSIPPNTLGANGDLIIRAKWTVNNSATSKRARVRFGAAASGVGGSLASDSELANQVIAAIWVEIENRGATNSQIAGGSATTFYGFGVSTNAWDTFAIDTTAATEINFTAQKATGTDTLTLESYSVWYVK